MMMREDKDCQAFRDGIMRAVDRSMSHSFPCPGTARGGLSSRSPFGSGLADLLTSCVTVTLRWLLLALGYVRPLYRSAALLRPGSSSVEIGRAHV